jgi:DNA invertase Pin-like site-specific DNA recombinase
MLVGYAKVSTKHQTLDLQTDALNAAGCEEIFTDRISGAAAHRNGLEDCLNYLNPGDTLVVWKIDRLGRSIAHLVKLLDDLHGKGIEFKSITESTAAFCE